MDIEVDSIAFEDEIYSLTQMLSNMSYCVDFLKANINNSRIDFTSVNFERLEKRMEKLNDIFLDMSNKLNDAKYFLEQLNEIIKKYNSLRY